MAAAQTNGPDPKRTQECVERIEALLAKKAELHIEYMAECSVIASDIKDIYTEAKSAWGLPVRAMKAVIKARGMERKLEALRDNLEDDDIESFDQIRHALGDLADTPLGDAATEKASMRAASKTAKNKALDAVAENVSRIADGISPLHS